MKASTYLANALKEYGTTHIFYQEMLFPQTMKEALEIGVTPVIAHTEFGAAYMADGYARASGRVGVCMAQAIGAPNLAAGIHDAYLGCTPLIAITGKKPPMYRYRNAYQDSEHKPFFEAVTKFSTDLVEPNQAPQLLRQAYKAAASGKPRPVHIDLLGFAGIEFEISEIEEPLFPSPQFGAYPPFRQKAETALVALAAKELEKAKRPIIVAGRGTVVSGAEEALLALAVKGDTPVVTTPDGKSIIDEGHPLWLGIVGGYGMDCANKAVAAADLVLFVGSQTSDQTTLDWTVPATGTRVIQIDIDAAELGRNYPNCLGLLGDARTVLEQLTEAAPQSTRPDWRQQVAALAGDTFGKQQARFGADNAPIDPARLCCEVSKALPDNGILVSDTGWSAVWASTMIRMKPSQSFIRAAGTLGWSYPASLGAKCGAPDRPVVNFIGDGGFYYCMSEMETAMRYNIPTVAVINNNLSLGQILAPTLPSVYSENPELAHQRFGFTQVNFANVAKEFGLHAVRVETPDKIAPAIQAALASGKPAVVEVMTSQVGPLDALEQ